ncbi:methyl-accepting chemotaxis protein [Methanolobus sp. WCC5]|uniref:methyl-accepting chemotaxis protein n=1 Tax=Methanolobus sp. WCC5 TaxID=3125785 RepID=UPI0032484E3A
MSVDITSLKKKMNIDFKSVKIKTTLYVVVALIAIFAVSGIFIINTVSEMETESAYAETQSITNSYANLIENDLNGYMKTATSLSTVLSQYGSDDRSEINSILRQFVVNDPDLLGAYVAYEPNAFDGKDDLYVNSPGHDSTGRFVPYWNRMGNSIAVDALVDYDTEAYYQLPKSSKQDVVTEPSLYQGQLMTSFISPIIVNGNFIGIAGTDADLMYLDAIMQEVKLFDTGYGMLLSNEGVIVTHPIDKSLIGTQNIGDFEGAAFDQIQRDVKNGRSGQVSAISPVTRKKVVYFYEPVETGNYAILVSVPEEEMLAGVKTLQSQIILIFVLAVGLMAIISYYIVGSIANPMRAAAVRADKIANGDLTGEVDSKFFGRKDEIGLLATSFHKMMENLNSLVKDIKTSADETAARSQEMAATTEQTTASANQISDTITEISRGAQVQSGKVEEVAHAMNDMNESVQAVAANSQRVSENAENASIRIRGIGQSSQELMDKMNNIKSASDENAEVITQLDKKSAEIGKIVNLITSIADQTNLLALNAAIEAARAGEHGRGFAVVADEVKKLADESGAAAKQIEDLIHQIQSSTHNAVGSMTRSKEEIEIGSQSLKETVDAIEGIVVEITDISKMVQEIAAAAQEQSASIEEVTASVEDVSSISEQSAASTQEASAAVEQQTASMDEMANAAQELASMADKLQNNVAFFKLDMDKE